MPTIFGVNFSSMSASEIVDRIAEDIPAQGSGPQMLVTTNLDHVVQLRRNAAFRACYSSAAIATVDGAPVWLVGKCLRRGFPSRITGADLVPKILGRLSPRSHRCFFVASSEVTAERIAHYLSGQGFRSEAISWYVPPFGFERDNGLSGELVNRIKAHRTTHLFMGVGSPKSEIWASQNRNAVGDCFILNVGAGLDFFAGSSTRAPVWMRQIGLEWFWRFCCNPRRLFKRYFIDSWTFFLVVWDEITSSAEQ